jgi:endo-1,4-beta-D-glucanase Y
MKSLSVRFSTRLAVRAVILMASVLAGAPARAQSNPFPTSGHYAQGFVPSAVTPAVVQSSYDNWKMKYLLSDCGSGYYRVDNATGDASTFSEGQGYGMVLTAYFGDKTAFDGLWSFAQKNFNTAKLMGWHVTCNGFTTSDGGDGSASDGDTDVAFGLVVAAAQWGGTYAQDATTYLASLKAADFVTCSPSGRNVVTAGSWQTGSSDPCTTSGGGSNTSYWMPGYYRVFQALTGDSFWGKTADDVVALYNLAADPTTGIIVNSVDQNGAAAPGQTYDYNSCRIPWRATLDYLWFGTAGAQQATTKISNWVNTVGITKIVDGYNANGSATGQYTGLNAFVGGFTAGAMPASQALVDSFATYFVSIDDDNGTYYGSSLRTLYLLELSGNQWNPLDVANDGGASTGGSDAGGSSGGGSGSDASSGGESGSDASSGGESGSDASFEGGSGSAGSTGGSTSGSSGAPGMDSGVAPGGSDGGAVNQDFGTSSGGCGCRLATSGSPGAAGAAMASMLALLALRKRKRPSI